jgi:hypothetical protein
MMSAVVSSKRHFRRKSCTRKRKFADKDAALVAARKLKLDAYYCRFCWHYHIGHRRFQAWSNRAIRKRFRWNR